MESTGGFERAFTSPNLNYRQPQPQAHRKYIQAYSPAADLHASRLEQHQLNVASANKSYLVPGLQGETSAKFARMNHFEFETLNPAIIKQHSTPTIKVTRNSGKQRSRTQNNQAAEAADSDSHEQVRTLNPKIAAEVKKARQQLQSHYEGQIKMLMQEVTAQKAILESSYHQKFTHEIATQKIVHDDLEARLLGAHHEAQDKESKISELKM